MKRIPLTKDGEFAGNWFDQDKAELFKENEFHNGNNWISKSTGSQWEHEAIYMTKSGKYILNHWSNYQGSRESYELIGKAEAAEWFIKNEYTEIPEVFMDEVDKSEIK